MFWELKQSHVPFEGVLAFCPEKVNMGLELQFEDVLLVDAVGLFGGADRVAEQGEASQREVVLQTGKEKRFLNTDQLTSVPSFKCLVLFSRNNTAQDGVC